MPDGLFYFLSKSIGFVLKVDNLLILSTCLGLLLLKIRPRLSVCLLTLGILPLFVLSLFPLGSLLLSPLEQRFPQPTQLPTTVAGIIILGGMESIAPSIIHQQPQFNSAAERIMVVPKLIRRYPQSKIIITSGVHSPIDPQTKGAHIIARWLTPFLTDNHKLHLEDQALNTRQNALYSIRYREDRDATTNSNTKNVNNNKMENDNHGSIEDGSHSPWLLVTSASHMPRSVGVFRRLNWAIIPYPVDYQSTPLNLSLNFAHNISLLRLACHEWMGLIAYYLNDYTDSLFPQPMPKDNF